MDENEGKTIEYHACAGQVTFCYFFKANSKNSESAAAFR